MRCFEMLCGKIISTKKDAVNIHNHLSNSIKTMMIMRGGRDLLPFAQAYS